MKTNENIQDSEPVKEKSNVWPFFIIIAGFIAILVLIKLLM